MELSFMEKKTIETNVHTLLTKYGYSFDYDDAVDIVDFVQHHGFLVGNAELPDNDDGFLAIQPMKANHSKIIGVNANRTLELKRFIIAHEFAHWVLHYKEGQVFLHRENKKGKNNEENDADYFAAALLMPNKSFTRLYNELKDKELSINVIHSQLAAIFKVPLESVSRRIDEVTLMNN